MATRQIILPPPIPTPLRFRFVVSAAPGLPLPFTTVIQVQNNYPYIIATQPYYYSQLGHFILGNSTLGVLTSPIDNLGNFTIGRDKLGYNLVIGKVVLGTSSSQITSTLDTFILDQNTLA